MLQPSGSSPFLGWLDPDLQVSTIQPLAHSLHLGGIGKRTECLASYGKTNATTMNVCSSCSFSPALIEDHNGTWYRILLWPVWVNLGCFSSQLLAYPQPSHWRWQSTKKEKSSMLPKYGSAVGKILLCYQCRFNHKSKTQQHSY